MKQWMSLLILAIVLAMATGCESMPYFKRPAATPPPDSDLYEPTSPAPAPPGTALPMAAEQRFRDVPLPTGLKEDANRSFVYQDAATAIGRMVYTTKAGMNELAQFYIQECPAADWELKHVIEAEGKELVFHKPGKQLIVQVRDLGVVRGRTLILTMTPTQ